MVETKTETKTQAEKVRFSVKDVDAWIADFFKRYPFYLGNGHLKQSVYRYAIELRYIAAHWEAARNFGVYGQTIREFEKPTIDPANAPTKFDLLDRLFRMMYKRSSRSLREMFRI